MLCRYEYQAWQDEVHGMQRIVRDGVETNIQVLGKGEVRTSAPSQHCQRHTPHFTQYVSSCLKFATQQRFKHDQGLQHVVHTMVHRWHRHKDAIRESAPSLGCPSSEVLGDCTCYLKLGLCDRRAAWSISCSPVSTSCTV